MSDNCKILIACHKPCEVASDSVYMPMQVGAYGKEDIGFARDDTNDNISHLNYAYSELTGLYWAWKNLNVKYLGLVHYRRYFTLKKNNENLLSCVLSKQEALALLEKYQVILPIRRKYYIETLYSHYAHTFDGRHFDITREIIAKKYPEYLSSFDAVMQQRSGYMFNMFLANKEIIDAYCRWLFDILFDLTKEIGFENMSDFEKRYPGRVAERLFNVWLKYNVKETEIREIPYIYLGQVDWTRKVKSFLLAKFMHKKYDKSF